MDIPCPCPTLFQMKNKTRRILILAPGAAVLVGIALAVGFALDWESPVSRDELRAFLERAHGTPWAFPLVLAVFVVGGFVMFPVTVMNLVSAMVFGPLWGVLYALAGAMLSAAIMFRVGELLGRRHLRKLMGRRLRKIDEALRNSGIAGMTAIRFVPIAPYGAMNLAAGVSSITFTVFIFGTLFSLIPGAVARGFVGDSLTQIVLEPTPESAAYLAAGLAGWGFVIVATHHLARKLGKREEART